MKACTERTCPEQSRRSRSGFTLPEVIIGMAVATLVGGLLILILVQSAGVFYRETAKVSQGLGLNDSLAKIESSIRKSQAIVSTSSASQLVLKIPSVDGSGNVINNTFDTEVFQKEGDKLKYKLFPDSASSQKSADIILTKNVDSLLFQYFDALGQEVLPASSVRVRASLSLKQQSATAEAHLRND